MLNEIRTNKNLMLVILLGLILRVLFVLFGAKYYFGREDFFIDGDTQLWVACIQNLVETGTYTLNPNHEYGYFGRTPGYSFFIGIFYLLTGKNWNAAFPLIAWTQVLLDVIAIFIVYKIGLKLFNSNKNQAVIPALLYAFYPFIIVWNPQVYSEQTSVFFLLLGIYYFLYEEKKFNYFFSGVFTSLSVLCRPQVLLIIPVMGIALLLKNRSNLRLLISRTFQFGIAVIIVYGSWPIRNYIFYNKIILSHDLRGYETWTPDVISFSHYIFSVKTEWEPQFSNILHNAPLTFPANAYTSKEDSLKLERAVLLSKTCGSGFSRWRGYWKEPVTENNCNEEIKTIFDELRLTQIDEYPLNFYVILPLQNLQKAIFKTELYDTKTTARKFASTLFFYRTLMILLGLIGIYMLFKSHHATNFQLITLLFFLLLYISLAAGTAPQFRNIEIRYFLPVDVLLLITASIPVSKIIALFSGKK